MNMRTPDGEDSTFAKVMGTLAILAIISLILLCGVIGMIPAGAGQ